ncbi:hypothetical protein TNCT_320441 [Trichonephila clavata]|uniref:Uncharacterized protein n=1 Tax=Trichonephila clavata TaxID=2740835 RepID=A0A8X6L6X6_TRICU|nr:hypothetical protein TNCT_320441 [Trichonephila clavata]
MKTSEIKITSISVFAHSRPVSRQALGLRPLLPPLTENVLPSGQVESIPAGNDLFKPRSQIMVGKMPIARAIKTLYQLSSIPSELEYNNEKGKEWIKKKHTAKESRCSICNLLFSPFFSSGRKK